MAASFAGKARGARGARPERPSKIWGARELRLDLATVRAVAERHRPERSGLPKVPQCGKRKSRSKQQIQRAGVVDC
jgi:hypothetical protein